MDNVKRSKYNLIEWYMGRVDYEKDRSKISEGDNQYLYVFGNPATQRIKIGVTNDILRRFKELQTAGGSYLSNIIYIKVIVGCDESPRFIEKQLHIFFKEKRKVGEWFELSVKDIIQIRNLLWKIDGEDVQDDTDKLAYFFNHKEPTGIVIG